MSPIIGILAGMGPRSTGPFLDLVVTACQELYGARDDIDFPRMLICSQPAPFYEDRPPDHAALEAATLDGLKLLESAGAAFLAMACNTVHIYHSQLANALSIPLLNIVDLGVQALATPTKVALVAARATAESGIYQRALRAAGHEPVDEGAQADVDRLLVAVRETRDPHVFRALWNPVLQAAALAGAEKVLIACLDLSGVLRFAETRVPTIDAAQCLAESVVRHWIAIRTPATTDA